MSEQHPARWAARGMELHFAPAPSAWDFVGFHNEALAGAVAERHNQIVSDFTRALDLAHDELDRHRAANRSAAQAFVQQDARIGILESQLGQAHAEIARLEQALLHAALMKTIKGARVIVADALRKESP